MGIDEKRRDRDRDLPTPPRLLLTSPLARPFRRPPPRGLCSHCQTTARAGAAQDGARARL